VLQNESGQGVSLVGEIAHIVGERARAARGASNLTVEERNEPENLLLLCRQHHKLVDDDPTTYTVEYLSKIKSDHIAWIAQNLAKPQPWRSTISQLTYINVPRLCEQTELKGYGVDLSKYKEGQTLHSLGWELNHVMAAFQQVLQHLSIDAVPINRVALHEGSIGMPVSFDRQGFRTKNIAFNASENYTSFTGNMAKAPHIYSKLGSFRIVLYIDQRWITTTTAFALFGDGHCTFSGLGRITGIDYEAQILTVTPWVLGVPTAAFEKADIEDEPNQPIDLSPLDSLVDMERAKRDSVYFSPPPKHCDLCRKNLKGEKYMIDGEVKDLGGWGCMCAACFVRRGVKIGWGYGQLFLWDENGWLEVAGFPPEQLGSDEF
jgi:hypothetical protein